MGRGPNLINKEIVNVKNDEKYSRWNETKSLQQIGLELGGVPEIQDKANTNSTTIIMLDPNDNIPGEAAGVKMKNAINRYRDFLLKMDVFPLKDSTYQNVVKDLFNTDDYTEDGVTKNGKNNSIKIIQLLVS